MGSKVIKPKLATELELDKYVNSETGELLVSELHQAKTNITVRTEGDYVIIKSDNYVVIDSQALEYIRTMLNRSEVGSVLAMTEDLKTPLNIVYNHNIPHTNQTLQRHLGFSSEAKFFDLIRKLTKLGILYQIKGRIMGEVRVIYMINPFLCRKRVTIDKKVLSIFDNLSTKK